MLIKIHKSRYVLIFFIIFTIFLLINKSYGISEFKDINSKYDKKIEPLVKKGIISGYSDNTFRKDNLITRSEFVKMLTKFFDLKLVKGNLYFTDVDKSYWAYKYINTFYKKGIINGTSKNSFSPEKNITYKQAIKMLIITLGYKQEAIELGGYPSGYLKIAKKLKILDKEINEDKYITRDNLVDILLNLKKIDFNTSIENTYGKDLSKNILIKNLKIDRVFKVRKPGAIKGSIHTKENIEELRWIFKDDKKRVIKVDSKGELDILKDDKGLNAINLKNYLKNIKFSNLGVGKYKFRLLLKTNKDIYTISDIWIVSLKKQKKETYKYPILNMDFLQISQSIGGKKGHKGTFAIDLVGIDSNKDDLYAPFNGTITKIYSKDNQQNFIWFESNKKLYLADGSYEYVTVMVGHDNDISDLYVGKEVSKGEIFFKEGDSGIAKGNHIHLEVAKGKTTKKGWIKNSFDRWHIENKVRPDKVFYINDSTTIIDSKDIKFKYLK